MFTDYEGFPKELYSESCSPGDLEELFNYLNLDDEDNILYQIACAEHGADYGKDYIEGGKHEGQLQYFPGDMEVWEIFDEMYPEVDQVEQSNPYLKVDYDSF